jgi:hypothetical protein
VDAAAWAGEHEYVLRDVSFEGSDLYVVIEGCQ